MKRKIETAMILAAGRGIRMGELTNQVPKPLLQVHDKALIEHVVSRLKKYGIHDIVVNTCYKGDLIKSALNKMPQVHFDYSDEVDPLETGGGVKKALPLLLKKGQDGFFVLNSDPLWNEPNRTLLDKMADAWDPEKMDILLALVPLSQARGDVEVGNYFIENSRMRRIKPGETTAPYFFISVQILHPRIFEKAPSGPFSLRVLYDKAQEKNRLFYVMHDGLWFNVNTPQALKQAQELYTDDL